MGYMVKELRTATGMTQKEFSARYGIPLSTLRKWEQGEASPAPYVLTLLARSMPSNDQLCRKIQGEKNVYYYHATARMVYDSKGNGIQISEPLEKVHPENLILYLEELFEAFYQIQDRFNRDCRLDQSENIIWRQLETSDR